MKKNRKEYKLFHMVKKLIKDDELLEHIASLPEDGREIFLMADEKVRVYAAAATGMVNQMKANHETGPLETLVLGQGYIAGALLSATVKGNDRILLQIECGGPIKGLNIEAWACGAVRGYLANNPIPLSKPLESLDTSPLYGPGFLSVTKLLEGAKSPFTGQVMMEYGNLANDLALYYKTSEQTPTLFYLSIQFDDKARVWGAGGLFLQALPGCSDDILDSLQEKSGHMRNLAKVLSEGASAKEYVEKEFADYNPMHLERQPLGFSCPCSKEGFKNYITSLPEKEKEDIRNGSFPLDIECFNCSSVYSFTKEEIEEIMGEKK